MPTQHRASRRYASVLLSLVLVTGLFPANVALADQPDSASSWSDDIPALLQAGEYEEGLVVACVDKSRVSRFSLQSVANDVTGRLDAADGQEVISLGAQAVADSVDADVTTLPVAQDANDGFAMITVSDPSKSTEQILYDLAADPAVLFAEPNYILAQADVDDETVQVATSDLVDAVEAKSQSGEEGAGQDGAQPDEGDLPDEGPQPADLASDPELASAVEAGSVTSSAAFFPEIANGDVNLSSPLATGSLTDQQYSLNPDTTFKTLGASIGQADINAPDWNSVSGNMDREVIVAVLDLGADYTNPDLQNTLVRFTPDQQEQLNCAEYGYNAVTGENPRDVSGSALHGTHCSGIICAEWNDFGVSGAGSRARVLNVRIGASDGRTSLSSALAGYAFLGAAVDAGIPVEVTSNSYEMRQNSRALNAAVYELGSKHNVTSVFATGNDNLSLDVNNRIGNTLANNPYVVMVAASNSDNKLASYSNHGVDVADLAAPGTAIYSTVTHSDSAYLPDGDSQQDRLFYEGFEDESAKLTFSQINPYTQEVFATQSQPTSDAVLSGAKSSKITLDHSWYGLPGVSFYALSSSPVTITPPPAGQTAYFGFGVYARANSNLFVGTIDGQFNTNCAFAVRATDGSWERVTSQAAMRAICLDRTWQNLCFALPENTDYENFSVMIGFLLNDADPSLDVYIDSVGVGTHISPYGLDTGTSMAGPLVAGEVSVQASQYAADAPENAADQRVKRILGSVRANDSCVGKVSTGGILDMSVTGSEQPSDKSLAPVITDISIDGSSVAITGANFGEKTGAAGAFISQYGIGQKGADLPFSITSWNDEGITLKLAGQPSGILNVGVTNASGKSFNTVAFASISDKVFEARLSVPDVTINLGSGVFDDFATSETFGSMIGLQDKLYYLPALVEIEEMPFAQRMWVYDIESDTWDTASALPEPLEGASMTIFEGMLVVEGATMDVSSGAPVISNDKAEVVYTFNPYTGEWSKACADNLPVGATLVNLDGKVYAAGGTVSPLPESDTSKQVVAFDPNTGAGERFATMSKGYTDPQVTACGTSLLVYSDGPRSPSAVTAGELVSADGAQVCNMPELLPAAETKRAFATVADGLMMAGPASKDGQADVFKLGAPAAKAADGEEGGLSTLALGDDASEFTQFEKIVSDGYIFSPAACAYDGQFYVMASSEVEPDNRVFRSTAVETVDDPNDISLVPEPDPTPTPNPGTDSTAGTTHATGDMLGLIAPIALLVIAVLAVVGIVVGRRNGRSHAAHAQQKDSEKQE